MTAISLPDELAAKIKQQAETAGQDIDAFVKEAVEEKLARSPAAAQSPERSDRAEWRRQFDLWMAEVASRADRYPPGFVADDSRESIYEGRGE